MKRLSAAIAMAVLVAGAAVAGEKVIPVWPGIASGSESWTWSEESNQSERDRSLNLRNIVTPTITVYAAKRPNGTAMLVIPGGGFRNLGFDKEGVEIARWLNARGITAFVLKYRLARSGDTTDSAVLNARIEAVVPLAIADANQAMRVLRARQSEWGIKKLGVIGFSAGGLLALSAATTLEPPLRPDFVVPVYAAIPRQMQVGPSSPPCFIVLAEDDRYGTDWSLAAYKAWHDAKAPVEMHIYARGNHGFALRKNGLPTDNWAERLADWMKLMGFLPDKP